jgi:hypothetical protein
VDPDPNFHLEVDPDPNLDWHKHDADPHTDPTPSFTLVGKSGFFVLLVTALPVGNVLWFSSVPKVS